MSAEPATVLLDASGPIWRLTLNRPQQGNACSADLVAGLETALSGAASQGAQAFVIEGEGRHFCTGFDLSQLDHESDDTLLARFVRIELMLQRLARAPFLTVALAHGRTMGAGADLFAACGLRLARTDASFAFPGARGFGLVLGTRRLAARVGAQDALSWVESGRNISVEEALCAGLVSALAADPAEVEQIVTTRVHDDAWLQNALRTAVDPRAADDDARDLDLLVRSAARAGLRDRIAAYVERVASTRRASPSPKPE
jgi:enoyl-CoA hydratase/carnithine racemase